MKKLIDYHYNYIDNTLCDLKMFFNDNTQIMYGFITHNFSQYTNHDIFTGEHLGYGVENILNHLSHIVDDDSFNTINALFMRQLEKYL